MADRLQNEYEQVSVFVSGIPAPRTVFSLHSFIMRAALLPLAFLPLLASAQFPNGGFENWVDQGGYLEPVGWLTYNDVPTIGGATVEQGTPGNPGNFHAVITSRESTGGGFPIQGWASAGMSGTNAGFPYSARPAMLTGQWQYGVQPNDTAQVLVALVNGANQTVIAQGTLEVTGSLATWQNFQVPLTYFNTGTPDTAYIQIVSSISFSDPIAGSFVKVDDLAFSGTVGIHGVTDINSLSIFPNPGTTHFTLELPLGPHTITLFDAMGRAVFQRTVTAQLSTMSTRDLAVGTYFIQVSDGEGTTRRASWVKAP